MELYQRGIITEGERYNQVLDAWTHAREQVTLEMMKELNKNLDPNLPETPAVRIGLNSGPVVVGKIGDDLRMDYTAIGDTTNLASRMQSLAQPGTILVSSPTHHLTQDFFQALVNHARVCVHVNVRYGRNLHHVVEAIFKSVARALRAATAPGTRPARPVRIARRIAAAPRPRRPSRPAPGRW